MGDWSVKKLTEDNHVSGEPGNALKALLALCAEQGKFASVDEEYYRTFLNLTNAEVESITIALMLGHGTTVRRLAASHADPAARVARFIVNGFATLSTGILQFDCFGRPRCCAPPGPDPSPTTDAAIEARLEEIRPWVLEKVRQALPWILSRSEAGAPPP
jgi:hypothetical protein